MRAKMWTLSLFIIGLTGGFSVSAAGQAPTSENLVGSWLTRTWDGGWYDSLHVGQEILTLNADKTWTERHQSQGTEQRLQKGRWSLAGDSLSLIVISDTAIHGRTEWPGNPRQVQVQDQQLVVGWFGNNPSCANEYGKYQRIDASKPLPTWASEEPPVTVKREDLIGKWVIKESSSERSYTLNQDGTFTQVPGGPDLSRIKKSGERGMGPKGVDSVRSMWTLLPGDQVALFTDVQIKSVWSHNGQSALFAVKRPNEPLTIQGCGKNEVYERKSP